MRKQLTIYIDIPSVPNFIRSGDGHTVISINDFTAAELQKIGEEWTKELIRKAKRRKSAA